MDKKYYKFFVFVFFIFFYFLFIETKAYKSSSIIKLKTEDPSFDIGFLGGITSSNDEAIEVKEYIFSDEGISQIVEIINEQSEIKQSFNPNFLDLNKIYFAEFEDYIQKFIEIRIDSDTGILTIETLSYDSGAAFFLNKLLLLLLQEYFDEKIEKENFISSTNSLCNLSAKKDNFREDFSLKKNEDFLLDNSINDILYKVSENRRTKCLDIIDSQGSAEYAELPESLKRKLTAEQSERLINEFLRSDQVVTFTSDKLNLISLPIKKEKPEYGRPLLKAIVSLLMIVLLYTSFKLLKIIVRGLN